MIPFRASSFLISLCALCVGVPHLYAQTSSQPYIDSIKKKLNQEGSDSQAEDTESYTEKEKRRLFEEGKTPVENESYSERLRQNLKKQNEEVTEDSKGFTEKEKSRLGEPDRDSAIQAVKEGRSELKPVYPGEINHAFGFRVGASPTRDLKTHTGKGASDFNEIYGTGWYPDVQFFWEYQPWHSVWFGSLGLVFTGGVTYQSGFGKFGFPIPKPPEINGEFGSESLTRYRFLTLPGSIGLNYRFNLLRFLRPYVQVSPGGIYYQEYRNDTRATIRGGSWVLNWGGGVNILLNGLSNSSRASLYETFNVKNYYLTVDFTQVSTLSGKLDFSSSVLSAGFTFEY